LRSLKTEEQIETRNNPLSLTPLELDVMKAVWMGHPTTVRDVQYAIRNRRRLAYTTVMTIMHRLYLKGFLQRSLKSRTHFYEPAVNFNDVRDAALGAIVSQFFEGSRDDLLRFLGQDFEPESPLEKLSPTALDETLL
jgi:predicted transcriptional regulator